jgi:hypothetical protein
MTCPGLSRIIKARIRQCSILSVVAALFCGTALAQGPALDAPTPTAVEPAPSAFIAATKSSGEHKFWDRENYALFATSAAMNTADFFVTRSNLQGGGRELNPIVRVFGRSNAGLAVNFAGETAGVVACSYFFHKTGHHRLERMVSVVNIGSSVGAVTYGLTHRNAVSNSVENQTARRAASFSIRINLGSK